MLIFLNRDLKRQKPITFNYLLTFYMLWVFCQSAMAQTSLSGQGYNSVYDLPSLQNVQQAASEYFPAPAAGESSRSIYISYSIDASNPINQIPLQDVSQGQSMIIRVIVPAGASGVSLGGESPVIQPTFSESYPLFKGFSSYPGAFCNANRKTSSTGQELCNGVAGDYVFKDDLHAPSGGISEILYQGAATQTEQYVYFILTQQRLAAAPFYFVSMSISYEISDINLYSQWRINKGLTATSSGSTGNNTNTSTNTNDSSSGTDTSNTSTNTPTTTDNNSSSSNSNTDTSNSNTNSNTSSGTSTTTTTTTNNSTGSTSSSGSTTNTSSNSTTTSTPTISSGGVIPANAPYDTYYQCNSKAIDCGYNFLYDLPLLNDLQLAATEFFPAPKTGETSDSLYLSYSVDASAYYDRIPLQNLPQGQAMLIRVIMPAGTSGLSIGGESPVIQSQQTGTYPLFKGFSKDPGNLCRSSLVQVIDGQESCSGKTGQYVYLSELHAPGGGLSEQLYNGSTLQQESYAYFVAYQQPQAVAPFYLVSMSLSYEISDVNLYQQWRVSKGLTGQTPIVSTTPIVPTPNTGSNGSSNAIPSTRPTNDVAANCLSNPVECGYMYIYDLPSFENSKEDAEVYFTEAPAGATDHSLFISYSVDSSQLIDRIPFYPLPQNKAFLARIIIPAGTSGASIGAESPVIQSQKPETYPLLKGFSYDPGDFCNAAKIYVDGKEVCDGETGDFLFPEDLHAPGGGINEQIYFGEPSPTERYGYFVVYQQDLAPNEFTVVSFDISYIIDDVDLYRQWRTSKGLANNNVPKQTYDSYAQSYAQGVNEGIARCRANPSSCGISTGLTCPVTSTIIPPATYDLASGQLYLPSVLIPAPTGTQNYEAYLLPKGNLLFEVDTSRLKQQ